MIHADQLSTLLGDFGSDEVWNWSDPQQQTMLSVLESHPVSVECHGSSQDAHQVAYTERTDNVLDRAILDSAQQKGQDANVTRQKGRTGALESRLATAREAQKRFRARHKAGQLRTLLSAPLTCAHLRRFLGCVAVCSSCTVTAWSVCGVACRQNHFQSSLNLPALLQSCMHSRHASSTSKIRILCWKSLLLSVQSRARRKLWLQ